MDNFTHTIKVLNSKLLIPRFSDTIRRERLSPLFSEIGKKRISIIVAGAGYGKTTLIAQACEALDLNTIWYRLDSFDKDFITFINYLIAGFRQFYSDFGEETFQRIHDARILTREREAVLTVLLSEIEIFIKNDIIIVLDDYHLIHESTEINGILNFLTEHLPRNVHLVIISRSEPQIQLSRYRSRRDVLDITEDDLAFTIPEIQTLFQQLFNISLQKQNIETLYKKTDGWVSGLILFYHSFKKKSPAEIEELLQKLKGSHKIVFNYLEENVYDLLPGEIMNFLTKTSILSRLNIDFCNRYLEITDSREMLMYLEEKHLFTWPFDEDRQWYYYHHLFQDFLQNKLCQKTGRNAVDKLHLKAAMLWEESGENEEAMNHYLIARDIDKACRLLSEMGRRKLLKEGRLQLINSYLKEIPESYSDSNPWIQFTKARVLALSGKPRQAITAYRNSYGIFKEDGFTIGIRKSLKELASNYCLIGDFKKAEKMFGDVLRQAENTPRFRLDILGYMIFITSHLGKMKESDTYYEQARSLPESNERNFKVWLMFNQGFRYGSAGDFRTACKLGEQVLKISEELNLYQLRSMTFHLIAWSCYYLGAFTRGIEYAEKGLQLIEGKGFYDSAQAWLLMSLALNETALGMIPEAIRDGRKSLNIFTDLEITWGQAYANHTLQYAYQLSGDLSAAEECARSALEIIRDMGLPLEEGYIKCGLADLLLGKGLTDEAGVLLEDAEKKLESSELNLCRTLMQYARFYWERKQNKDALDKLFSALMISEANHYDTWVVNEKHWIIPLLVELFAQGRMKDTVSRILKKCSINAFSSLRKLKTSKKVRTKKAVSVLLMELSKMPSPELTVYCFGKFKLFRGEEEITAGHWSSEKAKTLFKYLVLATPRGYQHKDILTELLWPDQDPSKTGNRLRVALTTLRKTLEPELERGRQSSYLIKKGDAYILNYGDSGWSDIMEFEKELQIAGKVKDPKLSISYYEKAVSLYHGDLFEEDPYSHWCFQTRDEYKDQYLAALSLIITHWYEKGDYHQAVEYVRMYLQSEKYDEDIYKVLMRLHSKLGNRGMITRTYEQCKEHLEQGLDCLPRDETESLYQQLMGL